MNPTSSSVFMLRISDKDAHDLSYLLRNYGRGVADIPAELQPLLSGVSAQKAMEYLRSDFTDSTGPRRAAEFLFGYPDDATQADVVGFVHRLLVECES